MANKTLANRKSKNHSLLRRFLSSLGITSKNKIVDNSQKCVEKMTQTDDQDRKNRGDFLEERFFDLKTQKFCTFDEIQSHLKELTCSLMLTNLGNKEVFMFACQVTIWLYFTYGRKSEMDVRMEKSQVAATTFTRFYKQLKM